MPPMFRLDPYAPCVHEPGGVYCAVEFTLVADEDNPLLTMIQEYSARRKMHFNHSRLHRGICVTNTCKDYLSQNTSADLRLVLEGCLNDTLWKEYKLKSKISSEVLCNDLDNKMDIDYGDIAVAVICLSILLLHVIGNLYDFCYVPNKDRKGNKLLLCFSIKRNWKKLVAPPACGPDTRLKRLKGFNGLRSLSIIIVIMEHSLLPFVVSSENSHNLEIKYYNIICHLFVDGTLLVQAFFLMSGCLLAYNLDLLAEKKNISWTMIPKGIILRWLRLTPTYALVLAVTTTWLRFAGSGPLWQSTVGVEVKDCRRDGWLNLIYLNNYIDESQCMPQTLVRDYFVKDPTFNHTYKRGHTNLASYIMGLGLGMLIYHLQKNDFSFERFKKYKYLYWATVPAVLIILPSGSFFYFYETEAPIILKAIFSGIAKPVFSSIICIIVLGMAFKFEDVYRGILEWNGWASPARVSYCTYILHMLFVRTLTGSRTTLMHVSIANVLLVCLGTVMMTYLVAYPFYLLVEAPSIALSKIILPAAKVKMDIENDPTKRERNHA
ncbi:Nose resistant to fluoxetine protein 6 [Papilio machaon]|uniref:Nose resistant to fluoxetine protein 6 n=1 Tax=Papilio machaon TaxID=76193 RepID=A0A194QX14_PAPMA|nr:Nose resistant to fluoxetine protein 6 [Papilio machaon]